MKQAFDVVCGMQVDPDTAVRVDHEGQAYYFCCDGCAGAFQRSPEYHLENWAAEHPDQSPSARA